MAVDQESSGDLVQVWEQLVEYERFRAIIAHHEAGHAVVAAIEGIRFVDVSIIEDEDLSQLRPLVSADSGQCSFEREKRNSDGGLCLARQPDAHSPELVVKYMRVCLAGIIAAARFLLATGKVVWVASLTWNKWATCFFAYLI